MKSPALYIARRYLFSRKSTGVINLISGISVCGVALTTMAMLCTLSVFNGFQDMMQSQFTAFDPDLRIEPVEGKVFSGSDTRLHFLRDMEGVEVVSETLEEQALLRFDNKQQTCVLKGVDDSFRQLTHIDSVLYGNGYFTLHDSLRDYGIPGIDMAARLGLTLTQGESVEVYLPIRGARINPANPTAALRTEQLNGNGLVFSLGHKKYDSQYMLASIQYVRTLLNYTDEVSALGIKVSQDTPPQTIKSQIANKLGQDFRVLDREEQQAEVFRIMKIEKLISFLFFTFILLIASFNVIGSLSMLIIDKQRDIATLRNLGADNTLIRRIFMIEGCLITFCGALIGLLLGLLLCYLQRRYGLIGLGSDTGQALFVIDAYPVRVEWGDTFLILLTVLVVGCASITYPIRHFSRQRVSHT
jgi:lipoprotein-releasing system permease protein